MISLQALWQLVLRFIDIVFRLPSISGQSTVTRTTKGNWIDINFTSERAGDAQLVKATWDWTGRPVWLDSDSGSSADPMNKGVDEFHFHYGNAPPGVDTQVFGCTFTGFDSGDYFRFTMDLDRDPSGGQPKFEDYQGGKLKLEFSDGTVIDDQFDVRVSEYGAGAWEYSAKAVFRVIFLRPLRPAGGLIKSQS